VEGLPVSDEEQKAETLPAAAPEKWLVTSAREIITETPGVKAFVEAISQALVAPGLIKTERFGPFG
jgi:hypothetical protein